MQTSCCRLLDLAFKDWDWSFDDVDDGDDDDDVFDFWRNKWGKSKNGKKIVVLALPCSACGLHLGFHDFSLVLKFYKVVFNSLC